MFTNINLAVHHISQRLVTVYYYSGLYFKVQSTTFEWHYLLNTISKESFQSVFTINSCSLLCLVTSAFLGKSLITWLSPTGNGWFRDPRNSRVSLGRLPRATSWTAWKYILNLVKKSIHVHYNIVYVYNSWNWILI